MIPRPIYEALPFIYAAAGAYVFLTLDPTVGKASGVLLMTAAFVVFSMRKHYRKGDII